MRRARIKVMATVPARRKLTRDVKDESADVAKSVPIEVDKEQAVPSAPSSTDIPEQPAAEVPKPCAEKNDVESKLEEPKSKTEKIEVGSKLKQPENEPPAVDTSAPEETCIETVAKRSELVENIIKESPSPEKQIVVPDNIQAAGSDDPKVSSTNVDAPPVARTSQTRTSFMRPTPRLDGGGRIRRNSVQGSGASASESEDDSRRGMSGSSSRVRNDSVSSVGQSPKGRSHGSVHSAGVHGNASETTVDGDVATSGHATKNLFPLTARRKRKMVVSESARKLAEARKEFLLKHEHKQPDKSKLIMYDLIYYNPVTNPMKKSDGSGITSTQRTSSSVVAADTEDEDEDDALAEALPVPQVKVGPDGSLIIDEQSLVIEHTGAKKSRQAMARTEALVDEEGNGNGFYKKRQKTKDWSKWETLKFYKAINTVGTDFLLIQTFFPERTRQEIKLKYKKEEKMNPRLIEKALANHQEFDIDYLKEDLATFEETMKQRSKLAKSENQSGPKKRGPRTLKRKICRRMAAASISESSSIAGDHEGSQERTICEDDELQEPTPNGEQKRSLQRRTQLIDIPSRSKSSSGSNESGSDTEIYQVKPTRSGRTPKVRKLQAPTIDDDTFSDDDDHDERRTAPDSPASDVAQDNTSLQSNDDEKAALKGATCTVADDTSWKSDSVQKSLSGISQVEPGSLVIVSRESADDPGETVLQVYMVSSDIDDGQGNSVKQNMTPVVLTPELLNTVTAGITKVAPIDIKRE